MYDPSVGRWLSQDPLLFGAGDDDLYRYVHNNPTNATDPTGLWTDPPDVGAGGPPLAPQTEEEAIDYLETHDPHVKAVTAIIANLPNNKDGKDAKAELGLLVYYANHSWAHPPIPGLGASFAWPETFGSHCFRWTARLHDQLNLYPREKFGKWIRTKTFKLPLPGFRRGPEHSVTLFRVKNLNIVAGVDNGLLNHGNHFFDPIDEINDPRWPKETTDALTEAVEEIADK
jgi:hypothetical protein